MSEFISPSMGPHGFSSHIPPGDQPLPEKIKECVSNIREGLHHIKKDSQGEHPNIKGLVDELEQLDRNITHFHIEMNKDSNRGLEKHTRDKFDTCHHGFLDELNDVKDSHETSLRDVLHDHKKLGDFLKHLHHSDIHHIGDLAQNFSSELSKIFH